MLFEPSGSEAVVSLLKASFFFVVREKLSVDKDSEISATSLRVSLACPVR